MLTIKEIENLPPSIKQEVFDFAEYLIHKHLGNIKKDSSHKKEIFERKINKVKLQGKPMSETLQTIRDEEKW